VRTEKVEDAVLGPLHLSEDEDWWEATVVVGNKVVGFKIGGDSEPSHELIAHARDIVQRFDAFERMVAEFLAEEAHKQRPSAGEIQQLLIEDICLFWPERPDDGMIYFKGSDEFKLWRCDYVNRQPQGLGFDS
jgi:hypothetical protein